MISSCLLSAAQRVSCTYQQSVRQYFGRLAPRISIRLKSHIHVMRRIIASCLSAPNHTSMLCGGLLHPVYPPQITHPCYAADCCILFIRLKSHIHVMRRIVASCLSARNHTSMFFGGLLHPVYPPEITHPCYAADCCILFIRLKSHIHVLWRIIASCDKKILP